MVSGATLLRIRLRDPWQEQAFLACWAGARELLAGRFRAVATELFAVERGEWLALVTFPLPGSWKLVARDRGWQELQARCPPFEVEVIALRPWHLDGPVRDLTTAELVAWRAAGRDFVLVDTMPPASYRAGHIPGAVSLPFAELDEARARRVVGDDRARAVVVHCTGYS
jgi:hypothetical protein